MDNAVLHLPTSAPSDIILSGNNPPGRRVPTWLPIISITKSGNGAPTPEFGNIVSKSTNRSGNEGCIVGVRVEESTDTDPSISSPLIL